METTKKYFYIFIISKKNSICTYLQYVQVFLLSDKLFLSFAEQIQSFLQVQVQSFLQIFLGPTYKAKLCLANPFAPLVVGLTFP